MRFPQVAILALAPLVVIALACGSGTSDTGFVPPEPYGSENRELIESLPVPDGASLDRQVEQKAAYSGGFIVARIYEFGGSEAEVREFYQSKLELMGFSLEEGDPLDVYTMEPAQVFVNASTLESDGTYSVVVDARKTDLPLTPMPETPTADETPEEAAE